MKLVEHYVIYHSMVTKTKTKICFSNNIIFLKKISLSIKDKNQRLIGKDGGITLLLDLLKSDDENLKRNR